MDDFMKTEAKDIISTGIEKASGATGINIEVSITVAQPILKTIIFETLTITQIS